MFADNRFVVILVIFLPLLAGGCASLPENTNRQASCALTDTDDTTFGKRTLPECTNRARMEWHLLNSYRRAIDPPTRVTSSGKRREYVHVGSTAASLPPTFPPEATRIGLSKCHSGQDGFLLLKDGLNAFVARVVLAHKAERSIDVQYNMNTASIT